MKKTRGKNIKGMSKKAAFFVFAIELFFALLLVSLLMKSVTINENEEIQYADSSATDKISCADGRLYVNNISASVPKEGNPEYDISYSWAESDTDYPTVPRAAIASYRNKEGDLLYEISLYKDSFTAKEDIPEGKDADNWFDDWKGNGEEGAKITGETVQAGKFKGFLVSPAEGVSSDSKAPYTLYFAVKDKNGISVYILEGILHNEEAADSFKAAMDSCTKSLHKK